MSKHLKKKNPPVVSSDDDDSVTQDLPTPGAADPVNATVDAGAPSSSPRADDGWQRVAEQLESLRTMLLQLLTLIASSAGTGRPQDVLPRGHEQRPFQAISEGPPWESTATITHAVDATRQEAAILGAAVEMRSEPAISLKPRGEQPCGAAAAECGGVGRRHRLPHIKEFITALAVLHSIPPHKKKTLKYVYAEMAEVYEPPSDTKRKFMHHTRGSNEFPLAYRGALLVLAVAAYPDVKPEMLDPLILGSSEDAEAMSAGQEPPQPLDESLPSGSGLRAAHSHLAENAPRPGCDIGRE
ncbi:unnamed protein product [Lampetra fluviatilis]